RRIGPPDADAEREPNDDVSRTMRIDVGQTRTGLLADADDVDYYRFFLAAHDRVRLTLQPPADGAVKPALNWYGKQQADGRANGPGEPVTVEDVFPPGDYQRRLRPAKVSVVAYRLNLERLPRFSCPADCAPTGVRSL